LKKSVSLILAVSHSGIQCPNYSKGVEWEHLRKDAVASRFVEEKEELETVSPGLARGHAASY
jgi:hypothetical protein